MLDITSRRNDRVRLARSLRRPKGRRESELFLVEGIRPIGELLHSAFKTDFILYAPESLTSDFGLKLIDDARTQGISVLSTSPDILDSLSEKNNSTGMIAAAHHRAFSFEDLTKANSPWNIAIISPQDPGNIGTILRTMDAFQAGALILLDGGADPWQPSTVRASMGTIFTQPIIESDFNTFHQWTAKHKIPLYGTSANGSTDLQSTTNFKTPGILLFGSERDGLTPEQAAACETILRIPMQGRSTSLNLAVATGIVLFAVVGESGSSFKVPGTKSQEP